MGGSSNTLLRGVSGLISCVVLRASGSPSRCPFPSVGLDRFANPGHAPGIGSRPSSVGEVCGQPAVRTQIEARSLLLAFLAFELWTSLQVPGGGRDLALRGDSSRMRRPGLRGESRGRCVSFWHASAALSLRGLSRCTANGLGGPALSPQGWPAPFLPLRDPGDRLFSSGDSYLKGDPRILSTTQCFPLWLPASWLSWQPLRAVQQGRG